MTTAPRVAGDWVDTSQETVVQRGMQKTDEYKLMLADRLATASHSVNEKRGSNLKYVSAFYWLGWALCLFVSIEKYLVTVVEVSMSCCFSYRTKQSRIMAPILTENNLKMAAQVIAPFGNSLRSWTCPSVQFVYLCLWVWACSFRYWIASNRLLLSIDRTVQRIAWGTQQATISYLAQRTAKPPRKCLL